MTKKFMLVSILCVLTFSFAFASSEEYEAELDEYAKRTRVISGGYRSGNRVLIRIDDHPFYINMPNGPDAAGLYLVAIHKDKVLLKSHYNTFKRKNASKQMANDITKLPNGTFVVVAAKDEPTKLFEEKGQKALYSIGAKKGLLNQESRTSYLCLGIKGLRKGQAIEKIGMEQLEHIGSDIDKSVKFTFPNKEEPKVRAGLFKIYDPSVGEKETWFINDHCFVRGSEGTWHMFGITQTHPHNPTYGSVFAHATAKKLTQIPWDKKPFALKADPKSKEELLWAPHIILHNGIYYMYYCAGDKDPTNFKIHLATSKDLNEWKRHPENPMIVDGFHARDPFILKVGNEWVIYYTATSSPKGGNYIVACQTSRDLIHWSNRKTVFLDPAKGKGGGPTESPFVVRRGEYYYLFIGPRDGYVGTDVFRSENPLKWELKDYAGHIRAHAAEVIRDVDGKWYVSHCGHGQGGVYLAPLYWNDGLDDSDTSLAASEKYDVEFEKYTKLTEAVSGGLNSGSRVLIRIGEHTFYDYREPSVGLAGLYVVAIYKNEVLLQYHYNTYFLGGASLGFSRDIDKLPDGTFVVVAAKGEPTRLFDEDGQKALYSIGAGTGLLNQKLHTSYLCIGVKGLAQGKAIEKISPEELQHLGEKSGEQINLVFPKKEEPQGFSRMPGKHEGLMFGDTEVIYYIPENFDPNTAQYLFGIHGAGAWRRPGALTRVAQFRKTADRENVVIIAPAFTPVLNRTPNRKKDIKNGKFVDPKIVKARRSFMMLLNRFNEDRSDLKLIEIFEFFNKKLMKRDKFYLDGHSGGGQFVARFVLLHPELIEKAAICSAGSFVFPRRDKDYPYGNKLDGLEETFGPQIKAEDLKLTDTEIDQKLNKMLDLKIFIIAGENETNQEDRPERDWQGKSTLEKAQNFLEVMREEDKRLKQAGLRPSSKPYLYELHVLPNVGHNSHETAKKANELLFPH